MQATSTSGYGEAAQDLIAHYEGLRFEDIHHPVLHLFPAPPAHVRRER